VSLGGSPIISFTNRLRFDVYCDRDLQVGVGVRETSPTGAIGTTDPTVTTGTALEWVGVTSSTPSRTAYANTWTALEFDPLTDPIQAAYGSGNGVLNSTTGKGALEHLYLLPGDNAPNPYVLYLDNFVVVAYHPITFRLESGPTGAAIDEYSGVITWAPTALGDSGFKVIATDHLGLTATNTFTVSVVNPTVSVTISNIVGATLTYGGGAGSQFVLLKSPTANAPLSGWARVATNTVTPSTFTITTGSAQEFYSIKSE